KAYREFYINFERRVGDEQRFNSKFEFQRMTLGVLDSYYEYLRRYQNGNYVIGSLRHMSSAITKLDDDKLVARELKRLYLTIESLKKTFKPKNYNVIDERVVSAAAEKYLAGSEVDDVDGWLAQIPLRIAEKVNKNYVYLRWARREFSKGRYIHSADHYRKVLKGVDGVYFYKGERDRIKALDEIVRLSIMQANGEISEESYLFESAMSLKKTKYDSDKAIKFLNEYKRKFKSSDSARIEMLKAFCYRDASKGKDMLKSLWRVVNEHPKHHLADDALAEIAVYYLLWERDNAKARKYLNQVVERYPEGNAVDNALNWIAWSYRAESKYQQALSAYLDLVKKEPLSRFVEYAFNNIVKASSVEEKGMNPILEYFRLTGKAEEAGFATFDDRPVIFFGNRDGKIKRLDVEFEWATKIDEFSYNPENKFAVFRAEDFDYVVNYAWRTTDDSLFFVALNKRTKSKSSSENIRLLEDKLVLTQLYSNL
uniref:tetratricopeptide repeat protein n=1 Tax=Pontibacterium sp. TaxID=2036026 RepID=UPI00356AD5A6